MSPTLDETTGRPSCWARVLRELPDHAPALPRAERGRNLRRRQVTGGFAAPRATARNSVVSCSRNRSALWAHLGTSSYS